MDDVRSWFSLPMTGSVETAGAPFWRLVPTDVTVAVVQRPVAEILPSLRRAGLAFDDETMRRHLEQQSAKLRQVAQRRPNVLSLTFADLNTEDACARLFEHCLPYRHDSGWWQAMAPLNLQINMTHALHFFGAYARQLEKMRLIARHEMLRAFRRPIEMDGIQFQQETLDEILPELPRVAGEECAMLGEPPEVWRQLMNMPLLRQLEAGGVLHVMTARSNGRMFGYLVSALGEAFHAEGQMEAQQCWFTADPSWPGLGRKLQHASIEDLRAKGVQRVMMTNLDGSRVGSLYRRLGAKETGQRFVLEL